MLRIQTTPDAPVMGELPERLQGTFETLSDLLAAVYIEGAEWAESFMAGATLGQIATAEAPSPALYAEAYPANHVAHMLRVEVYDEEDDLWLPLNGDRVQMFVMRELYERML